MRILYHKVQNKLYAPVRCVAAIPQGVQALGWKGVFMTLESDVRSWEPQPTQGSERYWEKLGDRAHPPAPKYQPSTWVKLFEPPTAFSFDEAWLLCQCAENKWLAWIPDYGEILLNENEFCHEFCTVES